MTEHEYRRQLCAVADAAEIEIDMYLSMLAKIRKELSKQSERAVRRRARAKRVAHFTEDTLLREAEIIESVVRQIRKAMT